MGRAPCCDKATVKRGPWSPEEDTKLKSYIEKHGTGGNWIALPQKIGLKRCGKSCRLRWLNYLRPNIRHGGFTEDEDNLICSLYISIGSRWSIIAAQLPGRTDNDIKNYWNTRLKKKLVGRQRRQKSLQTKREITDQKNYSITDDCLTLYNQLSPPPLPLQPRILDSTASNNISMMMAALEAQIPSCNSLHSTSNIGLNTQYDCGIDAMSVHDHQYHCSNSVMVSSAPTSFMNCTRDLRALDEACLYGLDSLFDISCLAQPPPAISDDHPRLLG